MESNTSNFSTIIPPEQIPFAPEGWTHYSLQETTGTYAWALNTPEIGECLIGDLIGNPEIESLRYDSSNFNANYIQSLLERDKLIILNEAQLPNDNSYALAIRFRQATKHKKPGLIALRRDQNKRWSYKTFHEKRGCRNPETISQYDFNGSPITCPKTADLGDFNQFAGYAAIPYAGIPCINRINISNEAKNYLKTKLGI